MCTRKGYAASVSQLALATAALYFPFFKPQTGGKRSAVQPQTIYSEVPLYQCDLVTEKCFVLRYDKATIKKEVAQFSFGFYSLMLTSLLLGLIVMVLYKPRTWCAFCPMGTMTQGICKLKNKE